MRAKSRKLAAWKVPPTAGQPKQPQTAKPAPSDIQTGQPSTSQQAPPGNQTRKPSASQQVEDKTSVTDDNSQATTGLL